MYFSFLLYEPTRCDGLPVIELSCPFKTTRRVSGKKLPRKLNNKSFIDQAFSSRSGHKHANKRTWPISSHVDRLVKKPYIDIYLSSNFVMDPVFQLEMRVAFSSDWQALPLKCNLICKSAQSSKDERSP